jgi:hypothetical protein
VDVDAGFISGAIGWDDAGRAMFQHKSVKLAGKLSLIIGGYDMHTFKCLSTCVALSLVGIQFAASDEPKAPKPGPENQRLAYFVGLWTTEGEMKPGAMGPGGKLTGTSKCEWFEGRFTVVCNSVGTTPMGPSKGIDILGYSSEEKVYTYSGVDNSGASMTTVPRGTVHGDTWTYTDESMMGGKKVKTRVIIKELSPTAYTFKMDTQGDDGKWATVMESKSTKAK